MKKNIIFDMDGVLLDTERMILDCWSEVGKKHQIPNIEAVFKNCIGTNRIETKRLVLAHYGQDFPYDKFSAESSEVFHKKEEKTGIPVKKGALSLLQYLHQRQYRIALASSTRMLHIEPELKQAGLYDFFDVIVSGDMVSRSKPEPDIYQKACELLQINPEDAYAIEDSKNGLRSAVTAGIATIVVPDLIMPDEEMKQMACCLLKDLNEVEDWIEHSME